MSLTESSRAEASPSRRSTSEYQKSFELSCKIVKMHPREDSNISSFCADLRSAREMTELPWRPYMITLIRAKLTDHPLQWFNSRETTFTDLDFYSDEEGDRFTGDSPAQGGWIHELGPQEWAKTGENLDNELFWKTYRDCAGKLPKNVAAVFNLREVDGVESKEICSLLNISESNLWVMLHRARMALRRCMETNWFSK